MTKLPSGYISAPCPQCGKARAITEWSMKKYDGRPPICGRCTRGNLNRSFAHRVKASKALRDWREKQNA